MPNNGWRNWRASAEVSQILLQRLHKLLRKLSEVPTGVTEANTKEEIQAYLREQGIEFSSKDTKAELLEKLDEGATL